MTQTCHVTNERLIKVDFKGQENEEDHKKRRTRAEEMAGGIVQEDREGSN